MDEQFADGETVIASGALDTWNRTRTTQELQDFINSHHERLPDSVELS